MSIPVKVRCGFDGTDQALGTVRISPAQIQAACELYGSNYILRMGLHYQRYVIADYLPEYLLVNGIYLSTNPAPKLTDKKRATSVTGNIGESILGVVARRKLGASRMNDVQPINATSSAKCPDFRVQLRPSFPASFQAANGSQLPVNFQFWPAESKAVETEGGAKPAVKRALKQLGTYWYERRTFEPNVVGFGIVCCFIYRGTKSDPKRFIRLYVFTPINQALLQQRIAFFYNSNNNRDGFLGELATSGSQSRSALKNA